MSENIVLAKWSDGEIRDENKVYIVWSYEDVQTLYPNLSDELALEALQEVARSLQEISTEAGWEILRTLLDEVIDVCELCGRSDRGDLLDGLCRPCNPDSHAWADEEENESE